MIYLNSPNVEIFFVEFIESPHLFLIVQIASFFNFNVAEKIDGSFSA